MAKKKRYIMSIEEVYDEGDDFLDEGWHNSLYEKLEDLWLLGLPVSEIAKDFGVKPSKIQTEVKRGRELGYNLPRRNGVTERRKTGKVFKE